MNSYPSAFTRAALRILSSTRPNASRAGALLLALCIAAAADAAAPPSMATSQSVLWFCAGLAQAGNTESDEVAEARAAAKAIIGEAEEEASRIRRDALKKAAQIEADAVRKAAEIEAAAIRKAAGIVEVPRPVSPAGRSTPVVAPRERYQNLTGIWSWKGNARNRKFELKQEDDGTVATKLFVGPRTRFYREDLRYSDGVLPGRTFLTVKTQTGNDEKRFRDFQLTISEDGASLVGTIIETADKNNREKRLDVVWNRIRD